MKKYIVCMFTTHILGYEMKVEAKNKKDAKKVAFQNLSDDTIVSDDLKDIRYGDIMEVPKNKKGGEKK